MIDGEQGMVRREGVGMMIGTWKMEKKRSRGCGTKDGCERRMKLWPQKKSVEYVVVEEEKEVEVVEEEEKGRAEAAAV
jgi:hypothetical protein